MSLKKSATLTVLFAFLTTVNPIYAVDVVAPRGEVGGWRPSPVQLATDIQSHLGSISQLLPSQGLNLTDFRLNTPTLIATLQERITSPQATQSEVYAGVVLMQALGQPERLASVESYLQSAGSARQSAIDGMNKWSSVLKHDPAAGQSLIAAVTPIQQSLASRSGIDMDSLTGHVNALFDGTLARQSGGLNVETPLTLAGVGMKDVPAAARLHPHQSAGEAVHLFKEVPSPRVHSQHGNSVPVPAAGATAANDDSTLPPIPTQASEKEAQLAELAARFRALMESRELSGPLIRQWIADYEGITGHSDIRYADNTLQLMRDHGDMLEKMFSRPIRINLASYAARRADYGAMEAVVYHLLKDLPGLGVSLEDVSLQSGMTAVGGIHAGYRAAYRFPDVRRDGVMSGPGIGLNTADVNLGLVVGTDWGGASQTNKETPFVHLHMGGGPQAEEETRALLQTAPERVILVGGFHEIRDGGAGHEVRVPGSADKLIAELGDDTPALVIRNGHSNPERTARLIAARIAELSRRVDAPRESSLLANSNRLAGHDLVEVDQAGEALSGNDRALQIGAAVRLKLKRQKRFSDFAADQLADTVVARVKNLTFGLSNYRENAAWQAAANKALADVSAEKGGVLNGLISDLAIDVMFASWDGMASDPKAAASLDRDVARFDHEVGKIPASMRLDFEGPHTIGNVENYARIRLKYYAHTALEADPAPEIFLGSTAEMEAYYARQGLPQRIIIGDSNGTFIYMMRGPGGSRRTVIHGIDSQARMAQVVGLMQVQGLDLNKFVVRGDLDHLRIENRLALKEALSGLDLPIGAVVLNDKTHTFAAVAEAAGVAPRDLSTEDIAVGAFRFRKARVVSHDGTPYYIVGFSPAYGEGTEDLVRAAYAAGARNFLFAGAGGSLKIDGKIGDVYNIVSTEGNGERLELAKIEGMETLRIAGPNAHHVDSPTPLEQTRRWAEQTRTQRHGETVDQEFFHAVKGLKTELDARFAAGAPREGNVVHFQSALYQSDVVGQGALEGGTVAADFAGAIKNLASGFVAELGVGAVATRDARMRGLQGTHRGLLDEYGQLTATVQSHQKPLSDFDSSTLMQSTEYDHIAQLKGQRRVMLVNTGVVGQRGRAALDALLSGLRNRSFWIAVKQSDPHYSEVLARAAAFGFETLLLAEEGSVISGAPSFILTSKSAAETETMAERLVKTEQPNDYEPNLASHFRVRIDEKAAAPEDVLDPLRADPSALSERMNAEAVKAMRALEEAVVLRSAFGDHEVPAPLRAPLAHQLELWSQRTRFVPLEELDSIFAGKRPVRFSGASKKSWPNITPANVAKVKDTIWKLLMSLDPKKDVIVLGTPWGVEAVVLEFAAEIEKKYGKHFTIVQTITENTSLKEISPQTTYLVPTGINWFGNSRPTLMDIMRRYNGVVIYQGGGAINMADIELALKLGVEVFLQRDPEGAASDAAKKFPQHSFDAYHDFAKRFYKDRIDAMRLVKPTNLDPRHFERFFSAERLSDSEIRAMIAEFKKDPFIAAQMAKSAGVKEGFTLEQHTEMILRQFERYFTAPGRLPAGLDKQFMRLFLLLHDLGKPASVEVGDNTLQHDFTAPLLDAYFGHFGQSKSAIGKAEAMLDVDAIGAVLKAGSILNKSLETGDADKIAIARNAYQQALESGAREIAAEADRLGMDRSALFNLVSAFFQMDAGSYTTDAGGTYPLADGWNGLNHLFEFDRARGTIVYRSQPAVPGGVGGANEQYQALLKALRAVP